MIEVNKYRYIIKDAMKEQLRLYRIENKENKKQYDTLYRDKNKNKLIKYNNSYYERNKETICAQKATLYECLQCSCNVSSGNKSKHEQSTKHKQALLSATLCTIKFD